MTKILVIDDEVLVRKSIAHLLGGAGYDVQDAEDGARGMALFRSEQPDLVVTGIVMPEQEGTQTITEMGNAKRSAKNIAISMAGASATPTSSRLHGTSAQWALFQSPSIQMNCRPSRRNALPRGLIVTRGRAEATYPGRSGVAPQQVLAERFSQCECCVAVPPSEFGSQFNTLCAWLDQHVGKSAYCTGSQAGASRTRRCSTSSVRRWRRRSLIASRAGSSSGARRQRQ
jgi:CheY-like chemotaxis protein